MHAIRVARKLGIPRVVFPVAAGVMSAIGLLASPLSFEVAHTRERFVRDLDNAALAGIFAGVEAEAKAPLLAAGLDDPEIEIVRHLDMHYHGQGHEIEVTLASTDTDVEAHPAVPSSTSSRRVHSSMRDTCSLDSRKRAVPTPTTQHRHAFREIEGK